MCYRDKMFICIFIKCSLKLLWCVISSSTLTSGLHLQSTNFLTGRLCIPSLSDLPSTTERGSDMRTGVLKSVRDSVRTNDLIVVGVIKMSPHKISYGMNPCILIRIVYWERATILEHRATVLKKKKDLFIIYLFISMCAHLHELSAPNVKEPLEVRRRH